MKSVALSFARLECALLLIVFGSRLAVFSYSGSPLPYYDQWIAEFNSTLLSVAMGQNYAALINPHNEHLLITTKILTLLGYLINGYWDIPFLVICSAGTRALTAAWTFQLIAHAAQPKTKAFLCVLCIAVFAIPFSGFNFLNGMQICFYCADLALVWSLRTTTNWGTPITSGLALIGGTLFGVASLASAAAIPACTLAAYFFQRRVRPGFWFAWTISVTIVLGFIFIGKSTAAVALGNHRSLQEMVYFGLRIISWPINLAPVGVIVTFLCAIAVFVALKHPQNQRGAHATILGLGVYSLLNAAFIAISRDQSEWHMRHWETNSLLPFAALAFGLRLTELDAPRKNALILTGIIALVYVFCMGNLVRTISWPYVKSAHDSRSAALNHYRALLLKQDLREESERMNTLLETKNFSFFDDPIGRFSLSPIVLENLSILHRRPLAMLSPDIIPARSPSRFSWFTGQLIASGWILGLLGIALGVAAGYRERSQFPDAMAATT